MQRDGELWREIVIKALVYFVNPIKTYELYRRTPDGAGHLERPPSVTSLRTISTVVEGLSMSVCTLNLSNTEDSIINGIDLESANFVTFFFIKKKIWVVFKKRASNACFRTICDFKSYRIRINMTVRYTACVLLRSPWTLCAYTETANGAEKIRATWY